VWVVVSRYVIKLSAISFISWGSVRRACGVAGANTDKKAFFSCAFESMVSRSTMRLLVMVVVVRFDFGVVGRTYAPALALCRRPKRPV